MTKHRLPQLFTPVDGSPKTLGALADRRRKEMGEYNYTETVQKMANERRQLHQYAGRIPEGGTLVDTTKNRDVDLSLTKMTGEETVRYVAEGKKPIGLSERK